MSEVDKILENTPLPKMIRIRQNFKSPPEIQDIDKAVAAEFSRTEIKSKIKPEMVVSVGLGSRGVAKIAEIARATVNELKKLGAIPFAVPAMGSHGGATDQGQIEVLKKLGMTEEFIGCEIRSSMKTVELGKLENGLPVYMDKESMAADGIICINRIKAHNGFTAPIESGVIKMLTIGFGKQIGAESCHAYGWSNMGKNIVEMARIKIANMPFLFGIGTIENAYDQVIKIEAIPAGKLEEREKELLAESKNYFPQIMFDNVDICLVDYMGKIYSGGGMDCHVIGRDLTGEVKPVAKIRPNRIVVFDLHDKSNGNASGMGCGDFITERLYKKISFSQTYPNNLTSRLPRSGQIPMIMSSDKTAFQAAVKTCIILDGRTEARVVRIANTLHIDEIFISENMFKEAQDNPNIDILSEPQQFDFDGNNNLKDIGLGLE